jgi:hypothetical protein
MTGVGMTGVCMTGVSCSGVVMRTYFVGRCFVRDPAMCQVRFITVIAQYVVGSSVWAVWSFVGVLSKNPCQLRCHPPDMVVHDWFVQPCATPMGVRVRPP